MKNKPKCARIFNNYEHIALTLGDSNTNATVDGEQRMPEGRNPMEGKINIPFLYIRQTCMQWRRQTSEFGGAFEGQTHILGGKIEFLKRYCFLPMPLSHHFCPPPQEIRPLSKGGDIPRYTAPGVRIT